MEDLVIIDVEYQEVQEEEQVDHLILIEQLLLELQDKVIMVDNNIQTPVEVDLVEVEEQELLEVMHPHHLMYQVMVEMV